LKLASGNNSGNAADFLTQGKQIYRKARGMKGRVSMEGMQGMREE